MQIFRIFLTPSLPLYAFQATYQYCCHFLDPPTPLVRDVLYGWSLDALPLAAALLVALLAHQADLAPVRVEATQLGRETEWFIFL